MAATRPRIQMYDDPHSLYCCKARIAFNHKGVTFTSMSVPCGGLKSAEYRMLVPLAKIPALVVKEPGQEQTVLMESEVIAEWLEERFPPPQYNALLPANPLTRAHVRMISRFHDLYFAQTLAKLYPQVDPTKRDLTVVHAVVKELQDQLAQLDILLHQADSLLDRAGVAAGVRTDSAIQYAVGSSLTLADCGYAPAFYYADLILDTLVGPGNGLKYTSRQQAWRQTLFANAHVKDAMAVLQPAALEWLHNRLGTQAQQPPV